MKEPIEELEIAMDHFTVQMPIEDFRILLRSALEWDVGHIHELIHDVDAKIDKMNKSITKA